MKRPPVHWAEHSIKCPANVPMQRWSYSSGRQPQRNPMAPGTPRNSRGILGMKLAKLASKLVHQYAKSKSTVHDTSQVSSDSNQQNKAISRCFQGSIFQSLMTSSQDLNTTHRILFWKLWSVEARPVTTTSQPSASAAAIGIAPKYAFALWQS